MFAWRRPLSRGDGGTICCRSRIIWKDIGLGVGGSAERELRTSSTWSQYYGAVKKSLIKKKHLKCVTNWLQHFLGVALTDFRYRVIFPYCNIFWDWCPTRSRLFFCLANLGSNAMALDLPLLLSTLF